MNRPAKRMLHVLLPGFAFAAGLGITIYALTLFRPSFTSVIPYLIIGGLLALGILLTAAGAFAFLARHTRPAQAEATSYAIGLMLSVVLFAVGAWDATRVPQPVEGEMVQVDHVELRRRRGEKVRIRLRNYDAPFEYRCAVRGCGDASHILALEARTPLKVQMRVVGDGVVGLRVADRDYLDVRRELQRRHAFDISVQIGAALLAVLCAFLGIRRLRSGIRTAP